MVKAVYAGIGVLHRALPAAAAAAAIVGTLVALPVLAETEPLPFATIHVVDATAEPAGVDWVDGISKGLTPNDGETWVFDARSESVLLSPESLTGDERQADGKSQRIADLLRKAVSDVQNGSSAASEGAVIDVSNLGAIFDVFLEVEDSYISITGRNPAEDALVNVVIWADKIKVGDADLSKGYLPEGCFGLVEQPVRLPEFLSIILPEALDAELHVRSLGLETAAATAEAMTATLSRVFVDNDGGSAEPITVFEAAAECGGGRSPVGIASVVKAAGPETNCTVAEPATPAPSRCEAPPPDQIASLDTPVPATPGALPAVPAQPPPPDPPPAPSQADPGPDVADPPSPDLPGADEEVAADVPPTANEPVEVPDLPQGSANDGDESTPASPEEIAKDAGVELAIPEPEVDPSLPPAKASDLSTASAIFAVISASEPVISSGQGSKAELEGAPKGVALTVTSEGQSPTDQGVLKVVSAGTSGRTDLVEDASFPAESGFFDVYLSVDANVICALKGADFDGRVSLAVSKGAQIVIDYRFVLSPVRCADVTESILVVDRIEVP